MKTLYLLRHAETTPPSFDLPDKNRKLTKNGIAQANELGQLINDQAYIPSLILCSDAVRTRQTYESLQKSVLHNLSVEYRPDLYGASRGKHFELLQNLGDSTDSAMIIAHNPGIFEIALTLAENRDDLGFEYPPCTLTVLSCSIKKWHDLSFAVNRIEAVHKF